MSSPGGTAVGSDGTIYVANDGSNSVTVYAPGANGNVAPIRTISGAATGINVPVDMVLSTTP